LSKSWQKVGKKWQEVVKKLTKSCQKVAKSWQKVGKKFKIQQTVVGCVGCGEIVVPRPSASASLTGQRQKVVKKKLIVGGAWQIAYITAPNFLTI
jgi:hypothetical protein